MTFTEFIGHEDAKLALILNVIDPNCGGVLFIGEKGSGKSTLARLFKNLLPEGTPFVNLPLNATEDALLGSVDMENTLKAGRKVFQRGILRRADSGAVYIDDVNLLAPEIITLVLKGQSQMENFTGRNGLVKEIHPSRFILLGSMNPEEGYLSSHFLDRFGMCVLWEGLKDPSQRMAVMKRTLRSGDGESIQNPSIGDLRDATPDQRLRDQLKDSRLAVKDIVVPSDMRNHITRLCIENCISGHRGDIFLFYAARAYAAFCHEPAVMEKHVDAVLPLVLLHRKRVLQQMEQERKEPQHHQERTSEPKEEADEDRDSTRESAINEKDRTDDNGSEGSGDVHEQPRESNQAEEIFDVGQAFKVKRLAFRKDRMNREVSGRRTKTGSTGKRGRHIKSILKTNDDIAIDATIRAAAPFQRSRGRKEMLLIRDEDLRFKQREKKMGHLVVLAIDGSGSMGAQRRMVETKGAVQSLLMDCYQKRDRVSMIVFRKDRAEVVLPPTSSVEAASKRLREIPVGGKTPLTAGLLEIFRLIKRVKMKSLETRFLVVLVTDGRANQTLSDAPVSEEIPKMTRLLSDLRSIDYIVIDTENKKNFIKTDLARDIASTLEADYYTIDDLKADHLTEIVRSKKAASSHS
jgi:magnesium chelatase subunit D